MAATTLNEKLQGKVAVVTGATTGIGKEIARGLARMGATTVLAVRNTQKGEAVAAEFKQETGNPNIEVMAVDTSEPSSIRAFAKNLTARHPRIQLLVNNAGAWFTDRKENSQGVELTWATNVLGPALLNSLLVDALKGGAPARIVNVVSSMASNYDPSDVEFRRRKFDGFKVYAQSKQALRMLTWDLAKKLEGTGVTVNAVAPGFVRTEFNKNNSGFTAMMINTAAKLFALTPAEGADTPLWAAVAPELEKVSGKYFDKRKEQDGKFREPGPIAELEKIVEQQLSGKPAAAAAPAASGSKPEARA